MERLQHTTKPLQKNLIIIMFLLLTTLLIIINNPVNNTIGDLNKNDPLNYLHSAFQETFTNIKLKNTTTGEIEKKKLAP